MLKNFPKILLPKFFTTKMVEINFSYMLTVTYVCYTLDIFRYSLDFMYPSKLCNSTRLQVNIVQTHGKNHNVHGTLPERNCPCPLNSFDSVILALSIQMTIVHHWRSATSWPLVKHKGKFESGWCGSEWLLLPCPVVWPAPVSSSDSLVIFQTV